MSSHLPAAGAKQWNTKVWSSGAGRRPPTRWHRRSQRRPFRCRHPRRGRSRCRTRPRRSGRTTIVDRSVLSTRSGQPRTGRPCAADQSESPTRSHERRAAGPGRSNLAPINPHCLRHLNARRRPTEVDKQTARHVANHEVAPPSAHDNITTTRPASPDRHATQSSPPALAIHDGPGDTDHRYRPAWPEVERGPAPSGSPILGGVMASRPRTDRWLCR
jgi:hypothetical protein